MTLKKTKQKASQKQARHTNKGSSKNPQQSQPTNKN